MKTTSLTSIALILLIIIAGLTFTALFASLGMSFVAWEWQWFWETNAGWRLMLLMGILGGGASR